jgi:hypothetical protein
MKQIRTQKQYYYTNQDLSFIIPAFSKILNIFIEQSNLIILYEFDDFEEEKKTINIKIKEGLENLSTDNSLFTYWGTVTTTNSQLINNSSVSGPSMNINMNIFNDSKYHHIFTWEIKPLVEMRDDKINTLI